MAGHSKWANIKHKKEKADAKKGKLFSRAAKEIISAVKIGGPDPKTNTRLRLAIDKARAANVPNDNIERNIKKAASSDQSDYTEMTYELYGHGGVGIVADVMTDNKNRTASDMRIATNKCGGSIANPGSVTFNFDRKGIIQVAKDQAEEEALFELATEAGAEDFDSEDDVYIVITDPSDIMQVKAVLDENNIAVIEANISMIPKSLIACDVETQEANEKLIDWLENLDDVDAVYHNMET